MNPGDLQFFVGPNGGGKSNLLDVVRWVSDSLSLGLDMALERRGGIDLLIRRASSGEASGPSACSVQLRLAGADWKGRYALQIGRAEHGAQVRYECCDVEQSDGTKVRFRVENGRVVDLSQQLSLPLLDGQSLLLPLIAGVSGFDVIYGALRSIRFLAVDPAAAVFRQAVEMRGKLGVDGANLAQAVGAMMAVDDDAMSVVAEYMRVVSPQLAEFAPVEVDGVESFQYSEVGSRGRWLPPRALSDGQVSALAILVSLFFTPPPLRAAPITLIEEPEKGLHPAAVSVLLDALLEASSDHQLLVSTHSADLLDDRRITPEMISHVRRAAGYSVVEAVTESSRRIIHERLCSAGELLRQDQLVEPGFRVGEEMPVSTFPFPVEPSEGP